MSAGSAIVRPPVMLPVESWQRVLAWLVGWAHRHPAIVRRLLRARVALSWVALSGALAVLLLWSPARHVAAIAVSGYLMLAVLAILSRTRTIAWTTIVLWFQTMLAWSVAVGLIDTVVAGPVVTALAAGPFAVDVGVVGAGAITAVAAIGEESLKLLPLALLAVAAPGRVRRFSRLDWLVLGYASGLAFMTVEEGVRTWLRLVRPAGLAELLGDPLPGLMWWPFSGRSAVTLGYAGLEQVPVAEYAGHNVLTGITAGCVGLAVWIWRRGDVPARMLAVVLPVVTWSVSVVDHFAVNAMSVSPRWLVDPVYGPTAAFRTASDVSGHGAGRGVLLVGLFALCLVLDARVMVRGAGDLKSGPVSALVSGVRYAVSRLRLDLGTVLVARRPVAGEARRASVDRARRTLGAVRWARLSAFAAVTEEREVLTDGLRLVVRSRRRVRLAAGGVGLILALCVPASAVLAARIGPVLSVGRAGWLSGLLRELADWWHALPWWQQVLVTAAIVLLVALLVLGSGGTLLAAVGLGSGVSGVATYTADHGHGLGDLVTDPGEASRDYLRTATLGRVVTDAVDFGLTFVPGSAVGGLLAKGLERDLALLLRDPQRLIGDIHLRHIDDTGAFRPPDWYGGPKLGEKDALGALIPVNKADPGADALAGRLGGQSRRRFEWGSDNEFDVVSDDFVAQTKPAGLTLNKAFRDQAQNTFLAAHQTGRTPYFHFEGPPGPGVLEALERYAARYRIRPVIDLEPLG